MARLGMDRNRMKENELAIFIEELLGDYFIGMPFMGVMLTHSLLFFFSLSLFSLKYLCIKN